MMRNDQLVAANLLSLAAILCALSTRLHHIQLGPRLNWKAASEALVLGASWADLVPPGSIDPFLAP